MRLKLWLKGLFCRHPNKLYQRRPFHDEGAYGSGKVWYWCPDCNRQFLGSRM